MKKGVKSRVFEFINRIVKNVEPKNSDDVIKYDTDNRFPQNLIKYLSESGTATRCIEELERYATAEGFVNEELGKLKCNETQTFNELLEELNQQSITFYGNALHISRRTDGTIAAIKLVPFENIRKAENCLIYNPTYSSDKFDKSKDKKHPYFKGPVLSQTDLAEVASYGEDAGEILYVFNKRPGVNIYPVPPYYSSIADIETDGELSKYELETVNNSFLPSGMLTIVGDMDDEVEDENGLTEWGALEENLALFTGEVKDEKGASGRSKLLVMQAATKDQIPVYQPFNHEGILTAVENATKRIEKKVAKAFGVPPFIIGLDGSVGFATNIIADNITLFNNRVLKIQKLSTRGLTMCFPNMDFTVTQLTPIKYIAPEILATLSDEEKRALAGYGPLKTNTLQNG